MFRVRSEYSGRVCPVDRRSELPTGPCGDRGRSEFRAGQVFERLGGQDDGFEESEGIGEASDHPFRRGPAGSRAAAGLSRVPE